MSVIKIHDLHIQKIADITHVPYSYLLTLRDFGMLNHETARDIVIRHDFKQLAKTGKYTQAQLIIKLSELYGLNPSKIMYILKNKIQHKYYCVQCGTAVKPSAFEKNGGLCDRCYIKLTNIQ